MCDTMLKLHVVLIVLCLMLKSLYAVDDRNTTLNTTSSIVVEPETERSLSDVLFSVTRAPRYFGILQDHRGQPLSVEISEEYMDQDYIATNKKRHKINWNKNPLDMEDFEDDDTEEALDEKDKDVKVQNHNLQNGPV